MTEVEVEISLGEIKGLYEIQPKIFGDARGQKRRTISKLESFCL